MRCHFRTLFEILCGIFIVYLLSNNLLLKTELAYTNKVYNNCQEQLFYDKALVYKKVESLTLDQMRSYVPGFVNIIEHTTTYALHNLKDDLKKSNEFADIRLHPLIKHKLFKASWEYNSLLNTELLALCELCLNKGLCFGIDMTEISIIIKQHYQTLSPQLKNLVQLYNSYFIDDKSTHVSIHEFQSLINILFLNYHPSNITHIDQCFHY